MPGDLTKRAAKMLLDGATLLGQPCPYCSGVRVMKDGHALCVSCGREPERRNVPGAAKSEPRPLEETLEKKLEELSGRLEREQDPSRMQGILDAMKMLLEVKEKARAAG